MDDRALIDRVLRGDAAAERALYDAHVDRVYGLAYRMTGDETLAQDFTQETFIRAFSRLESFRGDAKLSTWLHSITVSVVLNGLRKLKRHRSRETELDAANDRAQASSGNDAMLKRRLAQAVEKLSDLYRAVLVLHDVEGYKHEEISRFLDIPVGTSKARLSRARQSLRVELADLATEWTT